MALSRQAAGRPPTALALRGLGLGDLLTGVPALRGLRRALPDHRLVLATDPALQDLVALIGEVDELLPARGLEPLEYAGPPPDVAVNLHGRGPQSHRLLAETSPARTVAFASAEAGVDGPPWRVEEHEVWRWCRMVNACFGPVSDPGDLRLCPPDRADAHEPGVVVHPGAAWGARRWPAERFAVVAKSLSRRGHQVWVTGSPGERELATEVATRAGLDHGSVLAGRTSLAALAGLVSRAPLLVCGDTGTAHLSSAFGTPSVVLFGPTPPAWWGPPEQGPHAALWHGTSAGDPWASRPDPALLAITPEEVLQAAESLLAAAGTDATPPATTPPAPR